MTVTERQSNEKENQDKIIEWSVIWLKKNHAIWLLVLNLDHFHGKMQSFISFFISKNKLKKCQLAQALYLVLIIYSLKVTPKYLNEEN